MAAGDSSLRSNDNGHSANDFVANIFCDDAGGRISFFVKRDVPQRLTVEADIKRYGGSIAKQLNYANYVLADPNSGVVGGQQFSTQYIQDSISAGSMLDINLYRLKIKGPKVGRVKFTTEQENRLAMFVVEQNKLNKPLSGNGIYKEFEKANPGQGHTWQSWRDRATKRIIPRLAMYKQMHEAQLQGSIAQPTSAAQEGGVAHLGSVAQQTDEGSSRCNTPVSRVAERFTSSPHAGGQVFNPLHGMNDMMDFEDGQVDSGNGTGTHYARALDDDPDPRNEFEAYIDKTTREPIKKATRRTRHDFSVMDDHILVTYLVKQQIDGRRLKGNEIYKDLEKQLPKHSWHSWRDRAIRMIMPLLNEFKDVKVEKILETVTAMHAL